MAICGYQPASPQSPVPHPLVLSARSVPSSLRSTGGTVEVVGAVAHAESCQLQLVSRQSFPVVYSHNPTTACRGGTYTAHVVIGANPSPVQRTIAFDLVARNRALSFGGRFYILLAAPGSSLFPTLSGFAAALTQVEPSSWPRLTRAAPSQQAAQGGLARLAEGDGVGPAPASGALWPNPLPFPALSGCTRANPSWYVGLV